MCRASLASPEQPVLSILIGPIDATALSVQQPNMSLFMMNLKKKPSILLLHTTHNNNGKHYTQ